MKKNFHILTFGCQMNVCDSQWIRQSLIARGWEETSEKDAVLFVVNTCSVREKPEQKVYSLLGRLKSRHDQNPDVFVAVGGCVAQQVGASIWGRFPFVRLIFGTDGIVMVPDAVQRLIHEQELRLKFLDFDLHYPEREEALPERVSSQAFVNIMQGCDNFCTYCIVPFTRGRQKSRQSAQILKECRGLVESGARELTLLGQNVNSYGQDKGGDGTDFAGLLKKVAQIAGLDRIRFTTSHPKDIDPRVVDAFGSLPNLCPQLHLPVQSGADRVLKKMGRRYLRDDYLKIIQSLRRVCPDICLTTDLIVGFPGESDEDFEQTLDLMQVVGFESCYSFKYSDRPGTKAEHFPDKVDESLKSKRLTRLQELQKQMTGKALTSRIGRREKVLVDSYGTKGALQGKMQWHGRDAGGRIVNFCSNNESLMGKIIAVKITEAKKHSLFGEVAGEPW